jgi:hypothetical protein
MIALLGYPLAIEPSLRLASQTWAWTVGYVALIVMTALCAWITLRSRRANVGAGEVTIEAPVQPAAPVSWGERAWWVLLAFIPSSYLLGATTYVTSDLAAAPLLWVVPLALYLLSFILVFARRQLLPRRWVLTATPFAVAACVAAMLLGRREPLWLILSMHLLTLFLVSMVCHGELARRRPHASALTEFYLLMSLGGVLGGAFNALAAPFLFVTALEYPIAIALACLVAPRRDGAEPAGEKRHLARVALDVGLPAALVIITWSVLIAISVLQPPTPTRLALGAIPVLLALFMYRRPINFGMSVAAILTAVTMADLTQPRLRWIGRSFFGTHRVEAVSITKEDMFNELRHGTTVHGRQRIDPKTTAPIEPRNPTSYYHPASTIGLVMRELLSRPPEQRPNDVAVVGLGTGSLAAFAEPATRMTFYEIDPLVKAIAENQILFTFLSDARQRQAKVDVVLGDARLTLGPSAPENSLDLLVLDAFSGDAIPVHLLTREAMDRYVAKMRPGGLIAVHISNRYIDLLPVTSNLARTAGWACIWRDDTGTITPEEFRQGRYMSTWVVMARDPSRFGNLVTPQGGWKPVDDYPEKYLWTDDFSNIISVFKR